MNSEDLRKNARLVSLDNRMVLVQSNNHIAESMVIYNLEIADYHTFAVSDEQVWVHNCVGSIPKPLRGKDSVPKELLIN